MLPFPVFLAVLHRGTADDAAESLPEIASGAEYQFFRNILNTLIRTAQVEFRALHPDNFDVIVQGGLDLFLKFPGKVIVRIAHPLRQGFDAQIPLRVLLNVVAADLDGLGEVGIDPQL